MIRVERVGALAPSAGADVVRAQMRAAHRYRNTLVEIERGRRAALRDAEERAGLRAAQDALRSAVATVDEVVARVTTAKIEASSRSVPRSLRDELAAARAAARAARVAFRELRTSIRDASAEARVPLEMALDARDAARDAARAGAESDGRAELRSAVDAAEARVESERERLIATGTLAGEYERINELAGEVRRAARAQCGVFWGSYLLVEAAMDDAASAPLWNKYGGPNDPDFVRWRGEGTVGVQIQGGELLSDICGTDDTRLRITGAEMPPDVLARVERKRARLGDPTWRPKEGRDVAAMRTLWLRVGSEGRAPVWAKFPLVLPRPLPERATVKAAAVHLRLVGTREEWTAMLTIDVADEDRTEACGTGAVAVHLGWRRMDDELRVAVILGADGHREEIHIPASLEEELRFARSIQRIRDRHFEVIRATIVAALRGVELPERLADDVRTMAAWRSADRLRLFVRRWAEAGAVGGESVCTDAEAWREHTPEPHRARLPQGATVRAAAVSWEAHDRHLLDYQESQRTGAQRRRRELYRIAAARVARRYGVLVLDDTDRSELAQRPSVPIQTGEAQPAREMEDAAQSNRHLAAVSELEGAMKNAFRSRGGRVVEVAAAGETITCARCCGQLAVDPARVLASCATCDSVVDQDDNAARNKLAAYERSGDAELHGIARDGSGPPPGGASTGSKRFKRTASQRKGGVRQ